MDLCSVQRLSKGALRPPQNQPRHAKGRFIDRVGDEIVVPTVPPSHTAASRMTSAYEAKGEGGSSITPLYSINNHAHVSPHVYTTVEDTGANQRFRFLTPQGWFYRVLIKTRQNSARHPILQRIEYQQIEPIIRPRCNRPAHIIFRGNTTTKAFRQAKW